MRQHTYTGRTSLRRCPRKPMAPAVHVVHRPRGEQAQRRKVTPLSTMRFVVAIAVIGLVVCLSLIAALMPNEVVVDKLLPYIAPPLTLILNYYFGRPARERQ